MADALIVDGIRTPIGRYGGALAGIRADDLGAIPLKALLARNPGLDAARIDEVFLGCANQAGEDNRNVARMSLLLAGLLTAVPGVTFNRLCGSRWAPRHARSVPVNWSWRLPAASSRCRAHRS